MAAGKANRGCVLRVAAAPYASGAASGGDIEETFRVSETLKVFFVDARADVFPIQRACDVTPLQPVDDEDLV